MTEKLTTEQVMADLGRTIINNIKHNKHINTIKHINTVNDFTPSGNQQVELVPLASPPEASFVATQPAIGVALASTETPPWRYLKLDLFDNATPVMLAKNKRKLNLKLSFLLHNKSEYQYLSAALNTPWRNVKRGFDFAIPEDLAHYNMLEKVYQAMGKMGLDRIRASKCYIPAAKGKGDTVFGMSLILGQNLETENYHVAFIDYLTLHEFELSNTGLTEAQRNANCIASAQYGDMQRKRMSRDAFFGK